MITKDRILECFSGLVGWRESTKAGTCYESLTESLKTSRSSIYVNDIGTGMDLESINQNLPHDYSDANQFLTDLYEASVIELLTRWAQITKRDVYTKTLLANDDIGVKAKNNKSLETKFGRFVGFKITPKPSNSLRAEVLQLGGMFSLANQNLPIYFYASRQNDPIAVFYADYSSPYSQVWFNLSNTQSGSGSASTAVDPITFICDYINREKGSGMDYFIGYYEADLTGNAIQTDMYCGPCSGTSNELDRWVIITPICVREESTYLTRELFDIENVGMTSQTFGLFMKVNVKCDASEVICDNVIMFAKALQLVMLEKLFWAFYNSNETNSMTANNKQDYRMNAEKCNNELYGYVPEGSYRRIPGILEQLTIDFSNLDRICLGMHKRQLGTGPLF